MIFLSKTSTILTVIPLWKLSWMPNQINLKRKSTSVLETTKNSTKPLSTKERFLIPPNNNYSLMFLIQFQFTINLRCLMSLSRLHLCIIMVFIFIKSDHLRILSNIPVWMKKMIKANLTLQSSSKSKTSHQELVMLLVMLVKMSMDSKSISRNLSGHYSVRKKILEITKNFRIRNRIIQKFKAISLPKLAIINIILILKEDSILNSFHHLSNSRNPLVKIMTSS